MKAVTRAQIELAKPDSKWVRADEAEQENKELRELFIRAVDCGEGYDSDVNKKYLELTKNKH